MPTNLRKLRLGNTGLTDADALLASPTFAGLTNLMIWTHSPLPRGFGRKLRARFGSDLSLRSEVS